MANHLIIDFYGLPGSGKSTLSHRVAEMLRKAGYSISEVSYDMDHRHREIMRFLLKLKNALLLLLHSPNTFSRLSSIVKQTGFSVYSTSFYRQLLNIAYKVHGAKYGDGNDIQFFDEGFCQSVLSLYYNKADTFSESTIEKIVMLLGELKKIEYVFVETDFSTIQKRLHCRLDGDSRMERLSEKDMTRILEEQEHLCLKLPSTFLVDNKEGQTLTKNCEMLYNHIIEKINTGQ